MQKMLKKIARTFLGVLILSVFICSYAFASMAEPEAAELVAQRSFEVKRAAAAEAAEARSKRAAETKEKAAELAKAPEKLVEPAKVSGEAKPAEPTKAPVGAKAEQLVKPLPEIPKTGEAKAKAVEPESLQQKKLEAMGISAEGGVGKKFTSYVAKKLGKIAPEKMAKLEKVVNKCNARLGAGQPARQKSKIEKWLEKINDKLSFGSGSSLAKDKDVDIRLASTDPEHQKQVEGTREEAKKELVTQDLAYEFKKQGMNSQAAEDLAKGAMDDPKALETKYINDDIEKHFSTEAEKPEWQTLKKQLKDQYIIKEGKSKEDAEKLAMADVAAKIKETVSVPDKIVQAAKKRASENLQEVNKKITPEDIESATKDKLKAAIADEELAKKAAKKMAELEKSNPEKVIKMKAEIAQDLAKGGKKYGALLEKVKEKTKLEDSDIKQLLEDPGTKYLLMRDVAKEEIKENMKKTLSDRISEAFETEKLNAALNNNKAIGIALVAGALLTVAVGLIEKQVTQSIDNYYATFKGETPPGLDLGGQSTYGSDQLTPEDQKNMDALDKLATFYSTMDVRFKNTLSKFDYDDIVFQTAEKLNYAGGAMTAGIALLFDYKDAGNIAEGLTPIVVRFYPMHVSGNSIDPMQAMAGVTNVDVLELVTSLRSCSPDVVFFVKAISLLNNANKKIANLTQRQAFLSAQMNLLFARLLRTVDDVATQRANSIEPDEDKWESVYVHSPAQCFGTAPKVLRDFMADLTVDTFDQNGSATKVSFEQYIIDKFATFDSAINVKFEGDSDYQPDNQTLDNSAVRQRLFAIFSRALDDVLRLEKEMMDAKGPVKIIDAQANVQMLDCKKFYADVTLVASNNLKKVQAKFIDATVEYAADMTDAANLNTYNSAYTDYMNALDAFTKAALEFRKEASFYPFEKTLGYEPERILDFIKRECKRAYQNAKNKKNFTSVLPKVFAPFADNFPFSAQDLLKYSQEPGPVKSPARLVVG